MADIGYVNGRFMPLADAVVPVEDRGFLLGDAVYEVIGTYGNRPYALGDHLERLQRSLGAIAVDFDVADYGFPRLIDDGLRRSGHVETSIYIQVTRGVAHRRHAFPPSATVPTVVMMFRPLARPTAEVVDRGVAVITTADIRWRRCDIKTTGLLANVLARQEATERGAFEALLIDDAGRVTEGAATSVFRVVDGVIETTPAGPHALPSITRAVVLGLAGRLDLEIRERFTTVAELRAADEVFLVGTSSEIVGVVSVDGEEICGGRPGEVTRRLHARYRETTGEQGGQSG